MTVIRRTLLRNTISPNLLHLPSHWYSTWQMWYRRGISAVSAWYTHRKKRGILWARCLLTYFQTHTRALKPLGRLSADRSSDEESWGGTWARCLLTRF